MNTLKQLVHRLLRWSEKYTKTDMVYAVSGGFWIAAAQAAASLFSLPLSIVFAHYLSQNEYGIYKYALSVAGVVTIFSFTGISTAITRASARGQDNGLYQGIILSIKTSWAIVLIGIVGAGYYAFKDNYTLAAVMLLIGILSPLFNSSGFFGAYLNGKSDFKRAAIYSTIRNLLSALAIFAAIILSSNALVVIIVYFVSYTATGLFFAWYIHRKFRSNTDTYPEMGSFSLHVSVINGLATLADSLDSILLFQFIGSSELAIYSFAENIPEALNRFGKIFNTISTPKYAKSAQAGSIGWKSFIISIIFLPVVIAYFFAAPYIFHFLYPAYMSAVPYTQALVFMLLLNGNLPVAYLDAQAAIKYKYVLAIASSVVRIILVIVGVVFYGIWGVVAARLLSKFFGVVLGVTIARRASAKSA